MKDGFPKLSENIWFYGLEHHSVEINVDVTMRDNRPKDGATQLMDTERNYEIIPS